MSYAGMHLLDPSDTGVPPEPTRDRSVRLACDSCDRDDYDGISPAELAALIADGWVNVSEEQTHEEACKTYDDPRDEPPGYSVLDWHTHVGTCPDCVVLAMLRRAPITIAKDA
jgi:hypothetical protein